MLKEDKPQIMPMKREACCPLNRLEKLANVTPGKPVGVDVLPVVRAQGRLTVGLGAVVIELEKGGVSEVLQPQQLLKAIRVGDVFKLAKLIDRRLRNLGGIILGL